MARSSARMPKRFPVGSTYVVEARGSVQGLTLMHRYVQLPDGRRIDLAARFVRTDGTAAPSPPRPKAAPARRSRERTAEPAA